MFRMHVWVAWHMVRRVLCYALCGGCTSRPRADHEWVSGGVPVSRRRATTAHTGRLIPHDSVTAMSTLTGVTPMTGVAGVAAVTPTHLAATSVPAAPAVRAAAVATTPAVRRAAAPTPTARTCPSASTTSRGTAGRTCR
jgi:hypothetical protein